MGFLNTIIPYRSLLSFDNASLTAWGVLFILSYFVVSALLLQLEVKRIRRSLGRVLEAFSATAMSGDDLLVEPWERYSHTFLVEENRPRKTYEDAEDYFNEQTLLGARLNLRYWYAVPSTLVGMGILGTFFGLTFGVSEFGVDSTEKIRQSIAVLLSGMSTAFVTSLWGMLLSILFGWFEKWQFKGAGADIHHLCSTLNREFKMTKVDELRLARDYQMSVFEEFFSIASENGHGRRPGAVLNDLHKAVVGQGNALETVSEAVSSMSSGFSSNLNGLALYIRESAEVLSSFPAQLQSIMRSLDSRTHEAQAISRASSETLQQGMERQAGDLQRTLAELLDEVRKVISVQKDAIQDVASSASDAALASSRAVREESAENARQLASMMHSIQGSLAAILDRQQQNAQTFDHLISGSNNIIGRSAMLTERVDTTIFNLDDILKGLAALSGQIMQSTELLKTSSENLQKTTATFETHSDRLLNHSQQTLLHLESSLGRAEEVANAYANKFEGIQAGLNNIFRQMEQGLSEYQKNTRECLNEYLGQFAEQLTKAVQSLSGGIEELNEVFEEIADAKARLN